MFYTFVNVAPSPSTWKDAFVWRLPGVSSFIRHVGNFFGANSEINNELVWINIDPD